MHLSKLPFKKNGRNAPTKTAITSIHITIEDKFK